LPFETVHFRIVVEENADYEVCAAYLLFLEIKGFYLLSEKPSFPESLESMDYTYS
jgi:hypothetical protein